MSKTSEQIEDLQKRVNYLQDQRDLIWKTLMNVGRVLDELREKVEGQSAERSLK